MLARIAALVAASYGNLYAESQQKLLYLTSFVCKKFVFSRLMVDRNRLRDRSLRVLHTLLAQQLTSPTHRDIAGVAGVSERTVSQAISELKVASLVGGGYPASLGPGLGLVLGVSIGAQGLRAAIVDAAGVPHHWAEEPHNPSWLSQPPSQILDRVRRVSITVLADALEDEQLQGKGKVPYLPLLGIAIAWPSSVDRNGRPRGTILRHAAWSRSQGSGKGRVSLNQWTAETFSSVLGTERCHALNNANADALCIGFDQALGRATEPDDEQWRVGLIVRIGSHVNAATITHGPHRRSRLSFVDARLISGTTGLAGELGHLPIPESVIARRNAENPFDDLYSLDYDNARCSCGNLHHLDAFASAHALVSRLEDSGYEFSESPAERARTIEAALTGDLDMRQDHALRDVGRIIGGALAGPILMLDPHSITLTGPLGIKTVRDGIMLEQAAWKNAVGDTVSVLPAGGSASAENAVRGAALAVIRRNVYRNLLDRGDWLHPPLDFDQGDLDRLATLDQQ